MNAPAVLNISTLIILIAMVTTAHYQHNVNDEVLPYKQEQSFH